MSSLRITEVLKMSVKWGVEQIRCMLRDLAENDLVKMKQHAVNFLKILLRKTRFERNER